MAQEEHRPDYMAQEEHRPDYIAHGGEQHAALLGLVKATKEAKFQDRGWTLLDTTQWGSQATDQFINAQLTQRVNELLTKPVIPEGLPKLWTPSPQV